MVDAGRRCEVAGLDPKRLDREDDEREEPPRRERWEKGKIKLDNEQLVYKWVRLSNCNDV